MSTQGYSEGRQAAGVGNGAIAPRPAAALGALSDGLRSYCPADRESVVGWCRLRGIRARPELYPRHGLIAEGLAAGFMYETDSGLCLIEGFVTNPEAGVMARGRALESIARGLITLARELGYARAQCATPIEGIARLARKLGLVDSGLVWQLRIDL